MATTIGYQVASVDNIARTLDAYSQLGFDYLVAPLSPVNSNKFAPFSDVFLKGTERNKIVIHITKRDYTIARNAQLLKNELNYASFIGIENIVIDCPDDSASLKMFVDVIAQKLIPSSETFNEHHPPSICLRVPLIPHKKQAAELRNNSNDVSDDSPWERWNFVRMILQSHAKLFVALELNGDLPDQEILNRWLGEPIVMLILPTSVFLTNASNFPVLSKAHQYFVRDINFRMAHNFSFIISGNNLHGDIKHYSQYLNHLKTTEIFEDKVSKFCHGYEDLLQIPLQDNLDSMVYEVFETDSIKYQQYEQAIRKALLKISKKEIVVMVVGAGRGPLVEKTLKASAQTDKYVKIYAVEKNPNAIITLKVIRDLRWGGVEGLPAGIVDIVNVDMRYWDAPHKADLVISELLGSFGDNELSPECLDGVWRYVHTDTISIPSSYTSYLCPVQSNRLFSQLVSNGGKGSIDSFEFGYVVHVRNAYLIDSPKAVFTFEHKDLTKPPEERDNNRSAILRFKSKLKSVCHGFVGYFDCCLFEDVNLSILPSTQNANMYSWFPIYFPIKCPFVIPGPNEEIELHITRNVDSRQVWYEWTVLKPIISKIHNLNGKSYSIGLH